MGIDRTQTGAGVIMRMRAHDMSRPLNFHTSMDDTVFTHSNYTVRHWTSSDREPVAALVQECLESYGLKFEAQGADLDAIAVEDHYLKNSRGEFWVVVDQQSNKIVGSGGYYEVNHESEGEGENRMVATAVEIRKMYLLPEARGKKLGRTMLEVRFSIQAMGLSIKFEN